MYIWCISMCMFVCVRALCALCRLHKFICNWLLWSNLIWNVISHLIHIHIHILFYCLLQLQQEKHFKCHKNHNNTGICRLSKVVKLSFCKKKKKKHYVSHCIASQCDGNSDQRSSQVLLSPQNRRDDKIWISLFWYYYFEIPRKCYSKCARKTI